MTRAEIQVIDASPAAGPAEHARRWAVRCRIVRVLSGAGPQPTSELTVSMHSPSRTFGTPLDSLKKYVFTVDFEDPLTNPYSGAISVQGYREA